MQIIIQDFFSHKIHASPDDWPEKLCEIAYIFNEFDRKKFDRQAIVERARVLTGRWSSQRSDAAFRDEITAYLSYLGICHICPENGEWVVKMTETAKRFLICESPDVPAFLRIQLSLFQYPNPMGVSHEKSGRLRLQANARDKTLNFIGHRAHISPVRLLAVALKASAFLMQSDVFDAVVSPKELYDLANNPEVQREALPSIDIVKDALQNIRQHPTAEYSFESRFSLLKHTHVFDSAPSKLFLKRPDDKRDKNLILGYFNSILSIDSEFREYDGCKNAADLKQCILADSWVNYFDGLSTLSSHVIDSLEKDFFSIASLKLSTSRAVLTAPLRKFSSNIKPYTPHRQGAYLADPDVTRIKKERRNAIHARMIRVLNAWLEDIDGVVKTGDSAHIDLWANLKTGETYIFEIKSGGKTIFEQIRKGLAQLYEYNYRYRNEFEETKLCLVLPQPPPFTWLPNYLCLDRDINLCFLGFDAEIPEFHRLSREPIETS